MGMISSQRWRLAALISAMLFVGSSADIVVGGSEDPEINGLYKETGFKRHGRSCYWKGHECSIFYSEWQWNLVGSNRQQLTSYYVDSNAEGPPTEGWKQTSNHEPAALTFTQVN